MPTARPRRPDLSPDRDTLGSVASTGTENPVETPDVNVWIDEIRTADLEGRIGMYLAHRGVVRGTSRGGASITGMTLSVDRQRLAQAVASAATMPGIEAVRTWVNEGELAIGDDIMLVLVAGDIRDNVFTALQALVRTIKTEVVTEFERS